MWVMLAGNVLEAPELESLEPEDMSRHHPKWLSIQDAFQNDQPIQM